MGGHDGTTGHHGHGRGRTLSAGGNVSFGRFLKSLSPLVRRRHGCHGTRRNGRRLLDGSHGCLELLGWRRCSTSPWNSCRRDRRRRSPGHHGSGNGRRYCRRRARDFQCNSFCNLVCKSSSLCLDQRNGRGSQRVKELIEVLAFALVGRILGRKRYPCVIVVFQPMVRDGRRRASVVFAVAYCRTRGRECCIEASVALLKHENLGVVLLHQGQDVIIIHLLFVHPSLKHKSLFFIPTWKNF